MHEMTASKEWARASRIMYSSFVNELAGFLKSNNIKTILECGCGDGYILKGLAEHGFRGTGIDADQEMIELAKKDSHKNIEFIAMNWLDINKNLQEQYDLVMCRGNSLGYVASWSKGKQELYPLIIKLQIEHSLKCFFNKTRPGGMLYIDTVAKHELNQGPNNQDFGNGDKVFKAIESYDPETNIRRLQTKENEKGQRPDFCYQSYFISPGKLEAMVKQFNPEKLWSPKFKHEKNYHVVCARK